MVYLKILKDEKGMEGIIKDVQKNFNTDPIKRRAWYLKVELVRLSL